MSVLISSNMNLPVPAVGSEFGPTYAFDINSCLTLIDQHDHSPGKGIKIQPNGLNISSDLSFLGNSATNLSNVVFMAQGTPSNPYAPLQSLFVAPGTTAEDLWYADSNGVPIQITNGGTLNAVATTVSGITYTAGTFVFTQTPSGLGTTPASLDSGAITIRPTTAGTAFGVTLEPPGSITSQYPLILPLVPGAISFLTLDNVGNIVASVPEAAGITRSMLAPGALGSGNVQTTSGNATIVNTTDLLFASGPGSITLYSAATNPGRVLTIKKIDNNFNVIAIVPSGGQTIDGAANTTLNTLNETLVIASNGVNWQILSRKASTTPVQYTPTIVGWNSITASRVFSWREGAYLHIQGSFTVGTPNGTASSMSIAFNNTTGLSIDTTQTGGGTPVNTAVGYYGSDLSTNGRGVVIATTSTTTVSFGDNGQHSTSALIAEPGNVITVTGNTMTFFLKVPISGWNG